MCGFFCYYVEIPNENSSLLLENALSNLPLLDNRNDNSSNKYLKYKKFNFIFSSFKIGYSRYF